VTYKDHIHPHQSEFLPFLPADYVPIEVAPPILRFGVITFVEHVLSVVYQDQLPLFGGYIAEESIYGNAKYCPNATLQHKKHQEQYGFMPHLVFFASKDAAEAAGFRRCRRCVAENV
jgi:hypothetical protein